MKILWLLTSFAAAAQLAAAGDITGTITFKGTPPPEAPYTPLMQNSDCSAMYSNTPTTHFYAVGPGGGLGDVTVFLEDASGNAITGHSTGASAPPVLMDQKGCLYRPQLLAIQTDQKLLVGNSDKCIHNVHCTPTVPGNPEHNDVQMPGSPDLTYVFSKPEMFITFKCDIHPWMFAWVSVFDNPYFSVSGKDGKFVIKNVPPGKYIIVADHRKLGKQTAKIDVKDNGASENFIFEKH